jgi:hypothetical protein
MPKSKKVVELPVGGEIIEHVDETQTETKSKSKKAKQPLEPLEPIHTFGVSPAQMGFTPSIPIPEPLSAKDYAKAQGDIEARKLVKSIAKLKHLITNHETELQKQKDLLSSQEIRYTLLLDLLNYP